jgi:hypothetical protein
MSAWQLAGMLVVQLCSAPAFDELEHVPGLPGRVLYIKAHRVVQGDSAACRKHEPL